MSSAKQDADLQGAAGNLYVLRLSLTNAALTLSLAPISGLSERAFKTVIDIDLLGTYNTLKATLPAIRESKGSYVHISANLHTRGTPWQAHVSAAKAGVDALSAVIAVEEGPRGVRSNVIGPGWVEWTLHASGSRVADDSPISGTAGMDKLAPKGFKPETQIPLGRMGDGGESYFFLRTARTSNVLSFRLLHLELYPASLPMLLFTLTPQLISPTPRSSSSHQQPPGSPARRSPWMAGNCTCEAWSFRTRKVCLTRRRSRISSSRASRFPRRHTCRTAEERTGTHRRDASKIYDVRRSARMSHA